MSYTAPVEFCPTSVGGRIVQMFDSNLLDEAACRLYLLRTLRPAPICPHCKTSFDFETVERIHYRDRQVECRQCHGKSSPRAGTVMEGVHATYRQIMLVAVMAHWSVPSMEIAQRTGISRDTVRRLCERLRVDASL